jgi:hypothetical protein
MGAELHAVGDFTSISGIKSPVFTEYNGGSFSEQGESLLLFRIQPQSPRFGFRP